MARNALHPKTRLVSAEQDEELPTRIGASEQRSSLARKLMPHVHPPGASIAIIASSDAAWQRLGSGLGDELTTLMRLVSVSELDQLGSGPDVVIVERSMLQEREATLRRIRQRRLTATLVVVGAADASDVERLLDAGADDAIPDGAPELAARLRAAARRARAVNASMRVAVGDIIYDRESRRVWCAGTEVRLTRTEESLLDCLFWYMPRPVTVAELMAFVWGTDDTVENRNRLHVYIGYLRRKLAASQVMEIRTVRGTGYELAARE